MMRRCNYCLINEFEVKLENEKRTSCDFKTSLMLRIIKFSKMAIYKLS